MADQTTPADTANSYKWWVLIAAVVAQMAAAVSTQGIGVLAGFIQEDLNLSNADIGALAGVLNVAAIPGLLLVGQWLDRTDVRVVIGGGAVVMALAMSLIDLTYAFGTLLLCLLVVGAGYSTTQPGGSKAVFHWFAAHERGGAMGIRQAGLPLGGAAAAALFPPIAGTFGWRSAFLVGAGIILAGSALFCLVYRKTDAVYQDVHMPEPAQPLVHARTLFALPAFRQAALSGITLIAVQTVALMFLVLFLRDHFHLSLSVGALHLLVMQLAGAMGRILLAAWSDRLHHGRSAIVLLTIIGSMLGLLGLGLYPIHGDPRLLFVVSAWLGFFGFGWYGPWVAWVSELSPRNQVGATLGLAMALNQVAIVIAPMVFGVLADATAGYYFPGLLLVAWLLSQSTYVCFVRVRVKK